LRGYILILFLFLCSFAGAQTTNVLFLGNSYTHFNNLPDILKQLAESGGDTAYTASNTPGGYSLWQHLENPTSIDLIREGIWDIVILQEQSQHPTIPYYRDNFTFPAADSLNKLIQINNQCATTMFYMTWGRKYGGQQCIGAYCSPVFVDYFHMQDSLESAYMKMAYDNQAFCSPVGISWRNSIGNGDPIELFSSDGSHPSLAGSYLAACTFYAAIFNKSPHGLEYTAGLSPDDAAYLQQVATYTVMTNPAQWNIYHPAAVEAFFTYNVEAFLADFTNTSLNASEYLWDFGDPWSGTQNTSTEENPSHEFSGPGTYVVSLTAGFPCQQEDVYSDTLVILETGMKERSGYDRVLIFPNPARDYITIESDDNYISFRLIDEQGVSRREGSLNWRKGNARIPIPSGLPAGIYLLHLRGNGEQHVQKFLIR